MTRPAILAKVNNNALMAKVQSQKPYCDTSPLMKNVYTTAKANPARDKNFTTYFIFCV